MSDEREATGERLRRGSRWAGATLVVWMVLAWLAPTSVAAQSAPDELSAQAQSHYRRGQEHYEVGEYQQAAQALRKAYALTPMPLLLYNICLAEWRAGNLEEATAVALRARQEDLPADLRTKTDARLAAFAAIRGAREIGEMDPVASTGESAGGRGPAAAGGGVEPDQTGRDDADRADTSGRSRFGRLGWLGVGSAMLGAAGLTTAGVYDARVADAVERMERAGRRGETARAERIRRDDVVPGQRAGRGLLFAGAGLTAAGVALIVWDLSTVPDRDGRGSARIRMRPVVGWRGVGLKVRY